MELKAFKMTLKPEYKEEYRKRHNEIWPELKSLLHASGIADYGIFYDEDTNILFCIQKVNPDSGQEILSDNEIMKRWWIHMADIMEVNVDRSPVVKYLEPMFFME
jgi:L-rhamnose mutarotase